MQTIIGAGGAIGIELAKALTTYTDKIRLVSRHPKKINPTDELFPADVLIYEQLENAIEGSDIVYVTVGFAYNLKTWQTNWPSFIDNVIKACKKHGSKLVFFDNIYMYDGNNLNPITEDLPVNPPSKKGQIRAQIANKILTEAREGNLTALIARCADFYGPGIKNTSMLTETVFNPLSQNKKANWLGNPKFKHSFTYTPDAAKATALLGNTPNAYGEVWHLPTAKNPPTGNEWINLVANEMGKPAKVQAAPKFVVRILGLFIPIMKEMVEMLYQYEQDYVFDSSKFDKRFDFETTSYAQGIKQIVAIDYPN